MPELPEVETIRRGLDELLPGKSFRCVDVRYAGSLKMPSANDLQRELPGRRIIGIGRRGKYLLLDLDNGSAIVIHLRMTGRLVYSEGDAECDKHTHLVFVFNDGSTLAFSDVRKFGTIWWLDVPRLHEIKGMTKLGPEPLSDDFHFPYLNTEIEKRNISIKALLLNQEIIAGLGNIYADEVLHRAGIQPTRASRTLVKRERLALFTAIREVLAEAIEWRGTTMNDYRDSSGSLGRFQERLQVYRRHEKDCPRCGKIICRTTVAGRGTHYCPACQH